MKDRISPEYGRLEFVSREEYFEGNWAYVCSDDYGEYDVVRNEDPSSDLFGQYRWTNI